MPSRPHARHAANPSPKPRSRRIRGTPPLPPGCKQRGCESRGDGIASLTTKRYPHRSGNHPGTVPGMRECGITRHSNSYCC